MSRRLLLVVSLFATPAAQLMADATTTESLRPTLLAQYDFSEAGGSSRDGWRRLRPGLDLRSGETRVRAEYDVEAGRWTHAWVEIAAGSGQRLRAGHFKPPAGFEELTSGHLLMFLERSASRALASGGRRMGVQIERTRGALTGQLMLGAKSLDQAPEGRLFAARLYSASGTRHLGMSMSREFPRGDSGRIAYRPEINLISGGTLDTGRVENVRHVDRLGLEGAWLHGAWTFSSEVLWARLDRDGARDIQGQGGYVAASWTPFGEGRSLRGGTLQAPRAASGAIWELAARLAHADLELPDDPDGRSDSVTLGVNAWLPGGGAMALNQVRSRVRHNGARRSRNLTGLRLSWWF